MINGALGLPYFERRFVKNNLAMVDIAESSFDIVVWYIMYSERPIKQPETP